MTLVRKPVGERFWAKVDKGGPDDCWLWRGAVRGFGYGVIAGGGRYGKTLQAHRLSFELHFGPIAGDLCVLHKCDVPACVNPSHLFLGARSDNMADMTAKGRRASKLTAADAVSIRASKEDALDIARRYGVSRILIYHIRNGRVWSDVKEAPDGTAKPQDYSADDFGSGADDD